MTTPTTPENNLLAKALASHKAKLTAAQKESRPSPHIFIVGKSATGKSRSIKNLMDKETLVINIEGKILPFPVSKDQEDKIVAGFTNTTMVDSLIKDIVALPNLKYVIVDSFTKYVELLILENRAMGGGYEIYNRYYKQIFDLFELIKKATGKIFIFLANDEMDKVEQPNGALVNGRFISCEGKWFKKIEKEFSIVLFSELKVTTEPGGKVKREYKFITQSDGVTSAKSPEGLFNYEIENDLGEVVGKVEKYFGLTA